MELVKLDDEGCMDRLLDVMARHQPATGKPSGYLPLVVAQREAGLTRDEMLRAVAHVVVHHDAVLWPAGDHPVCIMVPPADRVLVGRMVHGAEV